MSKAIDWDALRKPFGERDLEWRIQMGGYRNGELWALVVPYVRVHAITERLDSVLTPAGWQNTLQPGACGGVMAGIGIKIDGEWVWKHDVAANPPKRGKNDDDDMPIKGGASNAIKRAGTLWGIGGRYLQRLPKMYAVIVNKGTRGARRDRIRVKRNGREEEVEIWWKPPRLPDWYLRLLEGGSSNGEPEDLGDGGDDVEHDDDHEPPELSELRAELHAALQHIDLTRATPGTVNAYEEAKRVCQDGDAQLADLQPAHHWATRRLEKQVAQLRSEYEKKLGELGWTDQMRRAFERSQGLQQGPQWPRDYLLLIDKLNDHIP